jgi:hypothetical protein
MLVSAARSAVETSLLKMLQDLNQLNAIVGQQGVLNVGYDDH